MRNPVAALNKATLNARLLSSFTKRDTVKQSTRHAGEWLVSSSQDDKVWYRVAYDRQHGRYSCGCKHWELHQTACRHLVRVAWEVDHPIAQPVTLTSLAAD